jgi:hypothetical protein
MQEYGIKPACVAASDKQGTQCEQCAVQTQRILKCASDATTMHTTSRAPGTSTYTGDTTGPIETSKTLQLRQKACQFQHVFSTSNKKGEQNTDKARQQPDVKQPIVPLMIGSSPS